jgi:hypothetical protein
MGAMGESPVEQIEAMGPAYENWATATKIAQGVSDAASIAAGGAGLLRHAGREAVEQGVKHADEIGAAMGRQADTAADVVPTRGGKGPNNVGKAGEDAVRSVEDIGKKRKIDVNGNKRIPDGLTDSTLSEVKNVSELSFTKQLQDYANFSQETGRRFDLYVRSSTTLSEPLNKAVASKVVNLRTIPGT